MHYETINNLLKNIFIDNSKHVKDDICEDQKDIAVNQTPKATVVTCSDSRVQSTMFDSTPVNKLFIVRNIGNQLATSMGSVEYGVCILNTPVLLIIGHINCGAIRAVVEDTPNLSECIHQELDTIDLPNNISVQDGVIHNIHQQVKVALDKFHDRVAANQLVIFGAVYDFGNTHKHGYNRLILVSINGETDPDIIAQSRYLEGINEVVVGV